MCCQDITKRNDVRNYIISFLLCIILEKCAKNCPFTFSFPAEVVINCLLAATGFHWHEYRNQIMTINFVCFLFIGFAVWVVTKSLQQYLCFLFLLRFLLFGGVGVADVAKIRIQKMIHSISICFSPNKLKTKHDTQIVLKWYNSLYKASILALFYKNKMTKLFFSITGNSDNLQFSSAVVWEIMEDAL